MKIKPVEKGTLYEVKAQAYSTRKNEDNTFTDKTLVLDWVFIVWMVE